MSEDYWKTLYDQVADENDSLKQEVADLKLLVKDLQATLDEAEAWIANELT